MAKKGYTSIVFATKGNKSDAISVSEKNALGPVITENQK